MPTFEMTAPDGGKYELDAPDENSALSAFATLHGGGKQQAEPVTLNKVVRSAATGVPIAGGLLNKADAALNAAVAPVVEPFLEKGPDTLDQPTFGERYAKSLELQNRQDHRFAEQHPVVDTAAKIAGGVGGMAPAIMAAPAAFGAAGTLPMMVATGAGSGALVSGLDAAVRGEPIAEDATIGGLVGAGAPLAGRAIGATVRALRGKPAPVPQNTVRVGNVEVPVSTSQVTGDAATSADEQVLARGGRGEAAQRTAQDFQELQNQRLAAARDEIGAGLDQTGASPGTAPQAAGERVLSELTQAEADRVANEAATAAGVRSEGQRMRGNLGGQAGAVVADSPYTAGELIGQGVGARRDAAVAGTKAKYDALKAEPGVFDPDVPQKMSENIRARLNTGSDPIWVDPDTTSKANEALKLIDQTIGKGMFANAAARAVGPVAEATAGATSGAPGWQARARKLAEDMMAQGVSPVRARAAAAAAEGGPMAPHSVAVPGGGHVDVAPKVVEASSIRTSGDTGYDPALQPRNRARAASDAQINDMANNLDPKRLGVSSEADRGAPIVGPDGMVESGNGRVMAIRRAFEANGEAAAGYREWLASQGVDVSKYKEPVLVRERTTPMTPAQRQQFTVGANQSATLSLSAPERALADAKLITPESLSLIKNPGDLGAVENRDFIRSFMQQVPQAERGALMTANGDLSSEGLARVRNAVLGKAYGDTPVLSRIAESTNDEIKSISNGLVAAAPEWASLRAAIAAGHVPGEMDATKSMLDAVNRTAALRSKGISLEGGLAQADAFKKPSAESDAFMRMFYAADGKRAASSEQIANGLRGFAREAAKVEASPGLMLGLPPVTAKDILETVAAKIGAPAEVTAKAAPAVAAATAEVAPEVGLREMDAARKRLVTMYGDAKRAAMAPGGSAADQRAMARILHEFDNEVIGAFESGKFSGDSEAAKRLLSEARASHAAYRQTYTSRGGGDDVGRAVEKILGRYTDSAATPDQIAKLSYGSLDNPGGGQAIKVAQRLRSILGETSPEWGAYKQGLFSTLEGTGNSPAQTADRIERFLDGTHGRGLAAVVLSGDERTALRNYATSLRATEPVPLSSLGTVDKVLARFSGRDGSLPASAGEVVDYLFGRTGTGSKGISVQLAARLKNELSPEGWDAVRQGMWSKLTNAGEGKIEFGPQALSQRLHEFINESGAPLAKVLFTPAERQQMAVLAKTYKQMIPVAGTTNPSGTAPMLAKIANKASSNLLAMIGAAHSGFAGLALGWAADRGLRSAANARGARDATRLFYGPQRKPPMSTSKIPVLLGQGTAPEIGQR